jgi:hypothetical protein
MHISGVGGHEHLLHVCVCEAVNIYVIFGFNSPDIREVDTG